MILNGLNLKIRVDNLPYRNRLEAPEFTVGERVGAPERRALIHPKTPAVAAGATETYLVGY
jgi:hypothetical protein